MAIFKVGQRVKRIQTGPSNGLTAVPLGSTGTVTVDRGGESVGVRWDNCRLWDEHNDEPSWFRYTLAPLTDPLAEQFIESLKKLAREPQPVTELTCQFSPERT